MLHALGKCFESSRSKDDPTASLKSQAATTPLCFIHVVQNRNLQYITQNSQAVLSYPVISTFPTAHSLFCEARRHNSPLAPLFGPGEEVDNICFTSTLPDGIVQHIML